MKRPALHWQILIALVLATVTGMIFRGLFGPDPGEGSFCTRAIEISSFVGDLFMQALKMIIVPLIVTSVISGIASLQGVQGFGRLGGKTLGFYALTTLLAVFTGLTVVNLIEPGVKDGVPNEAIRSAFASHAASASEAEHAKVAEAAGRQAGDFLDTFRMMIPPNVFQAATDNGQMLGVIVFSILFAIAMTRLPSEEIRTLRDFFQAGNDVMITLTRWIMAVSPIGVYALMFPVIHANGPEVFWELKAYFITVLVALGIHFGLTLPLILRFLGGIRPADHFRALREALLLAFSTASSSGTLPVTMRCVQENAGVSKRVSSFTLPLGATVNMDGTALYECVAVVFVAQVMGVDMGFTQQFFVVIAALLTSIGVAGVPSASLVAILLILKNSQVPEAETAVVALLAVDRLLDMSRTAVNVFGDSCAAVVIAKSEGDPVYSK
ncbi:Na+/H+-dicarboxylate symporter [Haloferula luteola]|uniref:Na+/H+-dicarboxylate symporter n=1 Tax=Haloferula luteola TaxID=595692 RepID=A0A840V5Y0_9BACT|nr:dicarboxylate/amino acid:cation symporter [Haloferula luteola]MBB5353372.1 Na+/H+-dicarboxylate symporter [Haloferula luteola]